MPSTYSPNLRIELIASGEQANTWGTTTNNNLGTLIGEAIAGLVDVSVTASDVVLTELDGLSDQSRQMMITISGAPGTPRTVSCPDGSTKVYVVANDSDDVVTFTTVSGSGVDIPVGTSKFLFCDGTDVFEAVTAIDTLLLGGAPTTSLEAANKGYVDAAIAAINYTANRAVVTNGSGNLAASATTSTEIGYVSGVTSAIQTQLNAKQATITGAASTITSSDLTASRALTSNASGKVAVSSVTDTELGYVSGVTSAIQTQLNNKPSLTGSGASGTWGINISGNAATATNGLTTSNYNSYAPTLTGTGASGTWGINITGNAATVTNGLTTSNYNSYAPTLTGTGASGTWAINISGTATNVTNALGSGQTWQNPSRSAGTTYTNSTGKPIQVIVSVGLSSGTSSTASVGGVAVSKLDTGSASLYASHSFVVPNSTTYVVTSGGTITNWAELR